MRWEEEKKKPRRLWRNFITALLLGSLLLASGFLACGSDSKTLKRTKSNSAGGNVILLQSKENFKERTTDLQQVFDGWQGFKVMSRTRSARCFARAADVETRGDDFYTGTPRSETIHLLRGEDIAFMDNGWDRVCGGKGDDILNGGLGTDRIDGGRGYDTCDAEVMRHCEEKTGEMVEVIHGIR